MMALLATLWMMRSSPLNMLFLSRPKLPLVQLWSRGGQRGSSSWNLKSISLILSLAPPPFSFWFSSSSLFSSSSSSSYWAGQGLLEWFSMQWRRASQGIWTGSLRWGVKELQRQLGGWSQEALGWLLHWRAHSAIAAVIISPIILT